MHNNGQNQFNPTPIDMERDKKVLDKIEEILVRQITEMVEVDVCATELYDAIAKPRDLLIQNLESMLSEERIVGILDKNSIIPIKKTKFIHQDDFKSVAKEIGGKDENN